MKYILLLLFSLNLIFISCNSKKRGLKEGERLVEYGDNKNGQFDCALIVDKNNFLLRKFCLKEDALIGNVIYYYESGIPKSIDPYRNDTLEGIKLDYYDSGIIHSMTSYVKGKKNGIVKIYYPNGYMKAINLVDNDSIYYVRIYPDTNHINEYDENLIPIVYIDSDPRIIGDTSAVKVKLPLNPQFGIDSGKYILRYDRNISKVLEGKHPYARFQVILSGKDIFIGLPAISAHDKFYCYITDKQGSIVGPTIYLDLISKSH